MSEMYKAEPGDVYVDANGTLWRVTSICREPTVNVESVEPEGYTVDDQSGEWEFVRTKKGGGVTGLMWDGFKRIYEASTEA